MLSLGGVPQVRDTGKGVPAAFVPELFKQFSSFGSDVESLGLGLFHTRQLMSLLGGTVSYAPNIPNGAVFAIEIPVSVPAQDTMEAAAAASVATSAEIPAAAAAAP
eukprot:6214649-Pleurochrysis_carterae.AAC.1